MQKILILTAGFGNGHNAAAFGLRDGLEASSEDVQVEVLDLFKICYGKVNDWVTQVYLGMVGLMPRVWAEVYQVLDRTSILEKQMMHFTRLKSILEDILKSSDPDAVVSTHPAYNYVIEQIYKDHSKRPFSQMTVVTDSISVNSVWYASPSDYYFVPNRLTADIMIKAGVPMEKVLPFGFPVTPRFCELSGRNGSADRADGRKHIVYIINTGKKKAGRIIDQLLELPNIRLTITCGADPKLKGKMLARTEAVRDRVRVLGWTSQMPEILCSSDLVITKAGGAVIQEAIAARAPIIINQVIPGQEEGNAKLVEQLGIGAVAVDDDALLAAVHEALEDDGRLLSQWKQALESHSHPDAALQIAKFILHESESPEPRSGEKSAAIFSTRKIVTQPAAGYSEKRTLLCDFHTHTKYSDGKLTVPELVDFYGVRGFDCLCVTDHLAEKRRMVGKLSNLSNLTLPWGQIDEYFEVLEREKKRAWKKYDMILMTGLEFNKDGWSKKSSAHLLGLDLKTPVNPDHDLKTLIHLIHAQGGLAVASHPHEMKSVWGKNTLFLWENQDEFVPLLDAWEIANRDDIFNPVGLKRLPFLANSDFHKPKHIYSWKTLLSCEKHPEAIKQCIRRNRDISITLYREPVGEAVPRLREPWLSEMDLGGSHRDPAQSRTELEVA